MPENKAAAEGASEGSGAPSQTSPAFTFEDRRMLNYAADSIELQFPGFASSLRELDERLSTAPAAPESEHGSDTETREAPNSRDIRKLATAFLGRGVDWQLAILNELGFERDGEETDKQFRKRAFESLRDGGELVRLTDALGISLQSDPPPDPDVAPGGSGEADTVVDQREDAMAALRQLVDAAGSVFLAWPNIDQRSAETERRFRSSLTFARSTLVEVEERSSEPRCEVDKGPACEVGRACLCDCTPHDPRLSATESTAATQPLGSGEGLTCVDCEGPVGSDGHVSVEERELGGGVASVEGLCAACLDADRKRNPERYDQQGSGEVTKESDAVALTLDRSLAEQFLRREPMDVPPIGSAAAKIDSLVRAALAHQPRSISGELQDRVERLEEALRTIDGPADSGPWILIYREAGGGYEGLQAIARAALEETVEQHPTQVEAPSEGPGEVE